MIWIDDRYDPRLDETESRRQSIKLHVRQAINESKRKDFNLDKQQVIGDPSFNNSNELFRPLTLIHAMSESPALNGMLNALQSRGHD